MGANLGGLLRWGGENGENILQKYVQGIENFFLLIFLGVAIPWDAVGNCCQAKKRKLRIFKLGKDV